MLIVLLAPWVDGADLIRDVFLTGSERRVGWSTWPATCGDTPSTSVVTRSFSFYRSLPSSRRHGGGRKDRSCATLPPRETAWDGPCLLGLLSIVTTVGLFTLVTAGPWAPATSPSAHRPAQLRLLAGLLSPPSLLPLSLARISARCRGDATTGAFAGVFVVVFTAAVFHSLSQVYFR